MKKVMAIVFLAAATISTTAFGSFFGWGCCGDRYECDSCPTMSYVSDCDDCGYETCDNCNGGY